MASEQANWQIPLSVTGPIDIGRLLREVQQIDDFLMQSAVREAGAQAKLPTVTHFMDEIVQLNSLNLLDQTDRKKLNDFLKNVKEHAPVMHISFSADPSPLFTQKLMSWLRIEIHPLVLINVGLQPNIGAGCVIRTPNKFFDFSLRQRFIQNRPLLIKQLAALSEQEATQEVTSVEAVA